LLDSYECRLEDDAPSPPNFGFWVNGFGLME